MSNSAFTVHRRRMLQSTAAVGLGLATPFYIPGRLLGLDGAAPPSERIRIGCIGVGGQGMSNLGTHVANVVAVCDVDAKRLGAAQAHVEKAALGKDGKGTPRKCAAYSDYRKLLDDKSVDAVIVSTPDHWHALATVDACAAGKDVYCEKPLTLTIAEGRAMVEAARKHNRIVQTGSQQRSDDKFRLACELVRSGRIGKVHTVRVGIAGVNFKGPAVADAEPPAELNYDVWLGPAPRRPYNVNRVHYNFRFFWDYSGGQITNWGAHHLDIAHWGLGMDASGPTKIEGRARFHKQGWYEVPEWFEVVYEYPGGVRIVCGMGERGGTTFEGEKGTIHVNRGRLESKPDDIIKDPLTASDTHLYVSKNHHANWLECLRTRKLPICDVEIGHRSATACHLGNIAIRAGRPITWDAAKEQIVGDAEAAKMVERPYREPWRLS